MIFFFCHNFQKAKWEKHHFIHILLFSYQIDFGIFNYSFITKQQCTKDRLEYFHCSKMQSRCQITLCISPIYWHEFNPGMSCKYVWYKDFLTSLTLFMILVVSACNCIARRVLMVFTIFEKGVLCCSLRFKVHVHQNNIQQ